jgi:hypothetical protein
MGDRNPQPPDPVTIALIGLGALFIPLFLLGLVAH